MFPKKVGRPVLKFRQAAELSLGGFLLSTKAVGAYPNPWRFWNTTGRVGEVCRQFDTEPVSPSSVGGIFLHTFFENGQII